MSPDHKSFDFSVEYGGFLRYFQNMACLCLMSLFLSLSFGPGTDDGWLGGEIAGGSGRSRRGEV